MKSSILARSPPASGGWHWHWLALHSLEEHLHRSEPNERPKRELWPRQKSWLLRRPQAAAAEQLNKMVDLVVQIKVLQRDLNEANGAGRPESAAEGAPPKEKRVRFDS